MKKYARVVDDVAVDISTAPSEHFHPDIAVQFEEVPDEVVTGSRRVDGVWEAPEPAPEPIPAPEPVQDMRITRLAFLNRFLMEERIAIRGAAKNDPVVGDALAMADAATFVDLSRTDTQQYIGLMVSKGFLTQVRADDILTSPIHPLERPILPE